MKSITGRITLIALLTAVSIIVLLPSLTDRLPAGWKDRMPKINLGLDLQGGVFLRLAVEIDKAIENTSMRYADDARAVCREKALPVLAFQKIGEGGFSPVSPGRLRHPRAGHPQGRVPLPRREPGRSEG